MASTRISPTQPIRYRGIITTATVLGAGLQGMDTLLAAVALPHIRGSLSLTYEEASWILTSYLIAVAIATPQSVGLDGGLAVSAYFYLS